MLTRSEALEFRPSLQPVGTRVDASERAVIVSAIGSAKVLKENCYETTVLTSAVNRELRQAWFMLSVYHETHHLYFYTGFVRYS